MGLNLNLCPQVNLVTDSTHLGPGLGTYFKEKPFNHQKYLLSRVTTQSGLKGRPTVFAQDLLQSTTTSTKTVTENNLLIKATRTS